MDNIKLITYQVDILNFVIERIRMGQKRILIEMPVGSGKTTVIKEVIENLIQNQSHKTIGLIFPNSELTRYYMELLRGLLLNPHVHYEYNRKSILIHNTQVAPDSEPIIYIVDESFGEEVKTVLKGKDIRVIGFYTIVSDKIRTVFAKKNVDYQITHNDLLKLGLIQVPSTNPLFQLNNILTKLSIPNDSAADLSKALLSLDFWINDYLAQNTEGKGTINDEKAILFETIILRKEALEVFDKLLRDKKYFSSIQKTRKEEKVWQDFFEKNKWIFGLNLNLYFLSSLDKKKYEQVVAGYTFNSGGKRVDGLLKSNGLMSSFHFCEIKTDTTAILHPGRAYRADSYNISSEFAGAIAQTQKTVFKAMHEIKSKQVMRDEDGYDTSEIVYNYLPQATIVIGSLNEFYREDKLNEQRHASFELFRKSLLNIQVITFDELYERAKAIVGIAAKEF